MARRLFMGKKSALLSAIGLIGGPPFGQLTVVSLGSRKSRKPYLLCRCSCGKEKEVRIDHLVYGHVTSCRCQQTKSSATHRLSKTKEWYAWMNMRARCNNPRHASFQSYGGRGIRVCSRWNESFINFLDDMGRRPSPQHSLGRKDNNGHYCPDNCEWQTIQTQTQNTRRTRKVTVFGITKAACKWDDLMGFPKCTVANRIRRGYSEERAVLHPWKSHMGRNLGASARPMDIVRSLIDSCQEGFDKSVMEHPDFLKAATEIAGRATCISGWARRQRSAA